jgi:hypothetical protein
MIVVFKYLIPKNYSGLTIFPFIFLKNKQLLADSILLNHEKIHLKQQIELLWIAFFIWYVTEYLMGLIKFRNHYKAYKNISFEKEAYTNENNTKYLINRKPYSFLNYL